MSLVTSNLFTRLEFFDETTITFAPAAAAGIADQIGSNNFQIVNVEITSYTAAGNTRFSSNVRFNNELTADHAYYLHRYL